MKAELQSDQVEEIYSQALDLHDGAARGSFLDRACAGDAALRRRVEQLLHARVERGEFLDSRVLERTELHGQRMAEGPGNKIGPYKLLEEIGEGGMGVVYMAQQSQPVERRVALKIIKPGMDTRQVIARFEAERQALALMDHPNIARVLDAGATGSGLPYFVMELVRGMSITEYCDSARLTIRQRLEVFIAVCRAVQHAHQKGIIHRDLKPSNILITVIDGVAVPKIIDFGVAKAMGGSLTEKTLFTGFQQFVGTPLYMSPEQADLSGVDVDTRSDVYSLGVLLYELLTGTTPVAAEAWQKKSFDEIRRMLKEQDPIRPNARVSTLENSLRSTMSENRRVSPQQLDVAIRGELDWIVMRALEKDRQRRYETPSALAADVVRYLNDEPVEACPPSRRYQLSKLYRRYRGPILWTSAVVTVLLIGLGLTIWQSIRAMIAEHDKFIAIEQTQRVEIEFVRSALALAESLAKDFPDDARFIDKYLGSLRNMTVVLERTESTESVEEKDRLRKAISSVIEKLVVRFPTILEYKLSYLSDICDQTIHDYRCGKLEAASRIQLRASERFELFAAAHEGHEGQEELLQRIKVCRLLDAAISLELAYHARAAHTVLSINSYRLHERGANSDLSRPDLYKPDETQEELLDYATGLLTAEFLMQECVVLAEKDNNLTPAERIS